MRCVVIVPSIWLPYTATCLATIQCDDRAELIVLDNTAMNRGVAGSWNVGARRAIEAGCDWLVCVSAAMRFLSPNLGGFLDRLAENPEAWMIEAQPEITWHLIAFATRTFERVGLFDENYWPGWGEEIDYSYRMVIAGLVNPKPHTYWTKVHADAYVESISHAHYLAGISSDHKAISEYHMRKWGAPLGSANESYKHPFNDEAHDQRWWPTPPDPRCYSPAGRPAEWNTP